MAVGRRLKLTLPILVGINFLHKIDPKLFGIFNFFNPKTYGKPIFGHSAAMGLTKMARHMGPNYMRWQFFLIKYTLF